MIATTICRRMLATLALLVLVSASAAGQERNYGDRRYDENAPRETASGEQARETLETGPKFTEGQFSDGGDAQGSAAQGRGAVDGAAPYPAEGRRPAAADVGQDDRTQAGEVRAKQQLQPAAPFQLNAQQQRFVDELLAAWEKHSAGIKTFECDFTRWEYTPNFGPVNAEGELSAVAISSGQMKYIKPDKGLFRVTETRIFNKATGKYDKAGEDVGEHWVCDGKVVWEVDHKSKQVKENLIPAEMQGTQIANGPLPFMLFGGEAAKLKARYFMREQTNPQFAKEEIWLESYPRWAGDAANYRSAHLIMKRADFLPYALRLYATNGTDYTVFEFRKLKLNNVFMRDIKEPEVPSGYQLVRAQQQTAQQGPAAAQQR